ncbi:MAG: HD domain-containing protein [Rhodobiaceae bacterium]|nr:HD domain-containing protein [Rhodobiaceae bacterium]MCC0056803.1 HD domain-containing protein [Rhodobiaceae bacterium]
MASPSSLDFAAGATRKLRLSEIIAALSHALDMTQGQPRGHSVRVCWIGMQIGRALGLESASLSDLYYTLLVKDLGCSSTAARICNHFIADDLSFKRDVKMVDGSLAQALRFVLTHTGAECGMTDRFKALYQTLQHGGSITRELVETRCQRGAGIAARLRFDSTVSDAIHNLDEHWDGSGLPERKAGDEIPLFSQIALISQVADVFRASGGPSAAIGEIARRAGSWFEPGLAALFAEIAADDAFWAPLDDPGLDARLGELEPDDTVRYADDDYLDDIATAFAEVIDSKSEYTAGHSERVCVYTDLIAAELGLAPAKRRWLKRAALLHDIGKLGISNRILDKAGKLSDDEFETIKRHPVFSEEILSRIGVFADIAVVGGGHHERLDGKGYPRGLAGDEIGLDTRIVTTADIFDALTADRPYRQAMPTRSALGLMQDMVGTAIDPACFAALKNAIESEISSAA